MKRASLAVMIVSSVALWAAVLAPSALAAANATCTSTLAPGTYQNVTVPTGAFCLLGPSDVILGNLTVATGGSLFSSAGPSIGGNLQANQADSIMLVFFSVGGDLQVTGTTGRRNSLCSGTVDGSLTVQNSAAGANWEIGTCGPLTVGNNLTVQNNAGDVEVANNTTQRGNISVHNNTGGGHLVDNTAHGSCQLFNDMPPIVGTGNSAGGTNTCNGSA